jgi:hypothetical protein
MTFLSKSEAFKLFVTCLLSSRFASIVGSATMAFNVLENHTLEEIIYIFDVRSSWKFLAKI